VDQSLRLASPSESADHQQLPDVLRLELLADPSRCLTAAEAAKHLGVGRTTVYRLMGEGMLTSIKIGRCRRIPIASIAEYVTLQLVRGTQA